MRMPALALSAALATVATEAAADSASVADVRAQEERFYQAFLDADVVAMDDLFADDFAYQHGSGTTFGKAAFVELIGSGAVTVTRADAPTMTVRDLGDTVVTYGNGIVEGMIGPDPYATDLRFVNVWHRVDDGWRLLHRNSELLPLPE